MDLSAALRPAEEGGHVALNPDSGTASQGEPIEEALVNMREAVELYLDEYPPAAPRTSLLTTIDVREHA